MIAGRCVMPALDRLPGELSAVERRQMDHDAAILDLVADLVEGAALSPRREVELRQAAADRFRHTADLVEQAVLAAVALERDERSADQHVRGACSCCSRRRTVLAGVCSGFRRLRQAIDRAHHRYRRAMKRLGRS